MPLTLSRPLVALTLMALTGMPVHAQQRDSVPAAVRTPVAARTSSAPRGRFTPPITPKRAFILSALLPGVGQSRLDRGTSGALFASVELAAVVMVRRSQLDLREARRYQVDTLPAQYVLSGSTLVKNGVFTNRYTADLVRTRRLHVEDWLAVIGFNHLFAGADAFVAAQLWDVPVQLTAVPRPSGALFVATVRF
ncbi:MAG: hypothetical protein P3C12_11815 [Gemmatimonadota bacterium]|nr:hypothetical protein [Gemmatimonadota bacterium]